MAQSKKAAPSTVPKKQLDNLQSQFDNLQKQYDELQAIHAVTLTQIENITQNYGQNASDSFEKLIQLREGNTLLQQKLALLTQELVNTNVEVGNLRIENKRLRAQLRRYKFSIH